jgi:hypothetical protein
MNFGFPEDSESMGLVSLALSLGSLSVGNCGKAEGIVVLTFNEFSYLAFSKAFVLIPLGYALIIIS